jgi:hypothetical protein
LNGSATIECEIQRFDLENEKIHEMRQ